MVKKENVSVPKSTYYCEGCGWGYNSLEKAETCEAKVSDRIYVTGRGKEWIVGDVAMAEVHCGKNTGYRLVKIDHEYESHHTIRPFLIPIDGLGPLPIREIGEKDIDDEDWGDYTPMHMLTMNVRILNEKWTRQLLTIADTLQSSASKANMEEV